MEGNLPEAGTTGNTPGRDTSRRSVRARVVPGTASLKNSFLRETHTVAPTAKQPLSAPALSAHHASAARRAGE
jgi:hypothetical protein